MRSGIELSQLLRISSPILPHSDVYVAVATVIQLIQ